MELQKEAPVAVTVGNSEFYGCVYDFNEQHNSDSYVIELEQRKPSMRLLSILGNVHSFVDRSILQAFQLILFVESLE